MRRLLLASLTALLLCTAIGACSEEQASDVPDQSAETVRGKGRILDELPEVLPIPADAVPSPLVEGLDSLMTFDEAFAVVKEHPHFVVTDSRIEARGVCPGLRTLDLEVGPWTDLGMPGTLSLTFYNDVLGTARFGPRDLEVYKARASSERNVKLRTVQRNRIEPWTDVWIPVLPPHAPTYSDARVAAWQDSVSKACRYQTQIEAGVSTPPDRARMN